MMDDAIDPYDGCCCLACIGGLLKSGDTAIAEARLSARASHPIYGPRDKAAAEEREKAARLKERK